MKTMLWVISTLSPIALGSCAATRVAGPENAAATPPMAIEEFRVPAADPGIELYVRNKHPANASAYDSNRILLFVHGASYPSETSFDLPLNGTSWMDYIAARGYDVYLVDLRGYGRSTRPKEMDQPAENNPPIVRTDVAVKDVAAAVEFIRKRRGAERINLMGWSWGTAIMGWYTAQNNDKVNKLVLYAPMWISQPTAPVGSSGRLGAYRTVKRGAAKARWLNGVPGDKKADLIPRGWFDAWADATFATDPVGAKQIPPVVRAPNGIIQDNDEYWDAGKPLYDPADIRVPTFLAHAEWDAELPSYMLYAYFEKLVNAPYKRYVQIGEGTHWVIMEKNRMQLFQAVQQFLDERVQPGQ